jgi:predicted nucleic acid-binding protein
VTVVDTSVVVAAFAAWHEQHEVADDTVATGVQLVAHCAIETFSVLTRLPPPHRAPGRLVRDFLAARFVDPFVALDAIGYRALIPRLVELGISGGAVYDALVAATASAAGDILVSCDRRAVQIYQRLGVDYRLLS